MLRRILRWFFPLLVAGFLCSPGAFAQREIPDIDSKPGAGSTPSQTPQPNSSTNQSKGADEEKGPGKDPVCYLFAIVSLLVVMLIVCKPSRKG
jgi:hypothetical protein